MFFGSNTGCSSGMYLERWDILKDGTKKIPFTLQMLRFQTDIGCIVLDQRLSLAKQQDQTIDNYVVMKNVFLNELVYVQILEIP